MTPTLDAVRCEELRKLAEAATHMPGPWDAGEGASFVLSFRDIDAGNDWPLRCVAYIAAMSPDTILALLARIAELEAGPKVKPLEWTGATKSALHSKTGLFDYTISRADGIYRRWSWARRKGNGAKWVGKFADLNEAKAAAQADYASRILAALLPKASVREERG